MSLGYMDKQGNFPGNPITFCTFFGMKGKLKDARN